MAKDYAEAFKPVPFLAPPISIRGPLQYPGRLTPIGTMPAETIGRMAGAEPVGQAIGSAPISAHVGATMPSPIQEVAKKTGTSIWSSLLSATPIIGAVGDIVGSIFGYLGAKEQIKQTEKINKQQMAIYERETAKEEKRYQEGKSYTQYQNKLAREDALRQERYARRQNYVNGLFGMMNANRAVAADIQNIWRR